MISSINFNYQGESKPGKILNLLSGSIEGWDPPVKVNLTNTLKSRIASLVEGENDSKGRTVLDSHANMVVVGKHCWVISRSKQSVDVSAFADDIKRL